MDGSRDSTEGRSGMKGWRSARPSRRRRVDTGGVHFSTVEFVQDQAGDDTHPWGAGGATVGVASGEAARGVVVGHRLIVRRLRGEQGDCDDADDPEQGNLRLRPPLHGPRQAEDEPRNCRGRKHRGDEGEREVHEA